MSALEKRQFENYRQVCSRIIGNTRSRAKTHHSIDMDRLSFKEIQNITRSMIKEKKVHSQNMGVISSVKGKMYCLQLGEVSNYKDFSHYFYTNQYKRKINSNT